MILNIDNMDFDFDALADHINEHMRGEGDHTTDARCIERWVINTLNQELKRQLAGYAAWEKSLQNNQTGRQ